MVSLQGYYIGSDEMPARKDNPKGFFENMKIYRFNQSILEACNTSWDNHFFTFKQIPPDNLHQYEQKAREIITEEFSLVKRIFIKDPRMCLLFPLWAKILKEMGFRIKVILAYRSPMEVAYSLKSRNDMAIEKSILMWSHYFFQAEKTSRDYKRMVVQYNNDLHDVDLFVKNLGAFLGTELNERIYSQSHKLYSPKLKHHQLALDNLSDQIPAYLKNFISILRADALEKSEQLDSIIDEFYFSKQFYLYNENNLLNEINDLKAKLAEQKEIHRIYKRDSSEELRVALLNVKNKTKEIKAGIQRADERVRIVRQEGEEKLKAANLRASKRVKEADEKLKAANLRASKRGKEADEKREAANLRASKRVKEANKRLKKVSNSNTELKKKLESSHQMVILREKESKQYKFQFNRARKERDQLRKEYQQLEKDMQESVESLSIANEVFNKIYSSRSWNRKLGRIIKGKNYFKARKNLSPWMKKGKKKLYQEKALIIDSGLFSLFYYLTHNPDVWYKKVDPLSHFCQHGWREGRNPGPNFNTNDYISMYDDVKRTGINPLIHYIKFGKKEGRRTVLNSSKRKRETNKYKKKTKAITQYQTHYTGETKGNINTFKNGIISGNFISVDSIPVIKVDDIPARNLQINIESTEFTAEVTNSIGSHSKIELLSLNEQGVTPLETKSFQNNWAGINKYADLEKAVRICQHSDAVAITVWDGSHNPIGRAKVLYDIISTKRPAIIIAYIFGTFSDCLWGPLRSSKANILLIPYKERLAYYNYFQQRNIKFNTIWICKYRLHSFELASMISKPDSVCILDMDDNEDVFVSSKNSELQPYGIFSKNKANYFLNRMPIRSVASTSLLENYGGMLVHHARPKYTGGSAIINNVGKTKTAVFIGTIRPHKNITSLVDALSKFNKTASDKIKLAIGGDFDPPSLKQTLNTPDTLILDEICNNELFATLAQFDVLITGFPDANAKSIEINKYQITSKIGDGLAVGRPVLTPYSPAVADLEDIAGLFIFTQKNFAKKLKQAINYEEKIILPKEFTLDYSYKTFETLEKAAKEKSLANNIFKMEALYHKEAKQNNKENNKQNIVLIWKQYDSGIYGRRIDHIARYYKQKHPDCNITVIEAMTENQINQMLTTWSQFDNSTAIINEILLQKLYQYNLEGVNYRMISYEDSDNWNSFESHFSNFLNAESINPYNTVMILFPLHPVFDKILNLISHYKIIVDLVDNQINWITTPEGRLKGLKQYYDLISIADKVVSNSPQNIQHFNKLGFFGKTEPEVIANWYTLPDSITFQRQINPEEINLLYSGNMNDRIDWKLLQDICKLLAKFNGQLHIAGSSIRRATEMQELLHEANCIYHGVVKEDQLLRLLQHINFAVIPHIEDKISKFMDPIKLKMYAKLGIPSLTTRLPGLPSDNPLLIIADSRSDFLTKLDDMLSNPLSIRDFNNNGYDEIGEKYSDLINQIFRIFTNK
jgi:glycosyltransferase involved in cell wall biosynthesis